MQTNIFLYGKMNAWFIMGRMIKAIKLGGCFNSKKTWKEPANLIYLLHDPYKMY